MFTTMENILSQLNKADERDLDNLQDYVSNLEVDEITSFITAHINLPNGLELLNKIFSGFTKTASSQRRKCQVLLSVLRFVDEKEISDRYCKQIVHNLCRQLKKFEAEHLIQVLEYCMQKIQSGNVTSSSWTDIVPHALYIIVEKESTVNYNNMEINASEFRKQFLSTLCTISWSANIGTKLATMFENITLSKDEHLQVLSKFGECMNKMSSQEIPALTYQLLKKCSRQNSKALFLRLQDYFENRIYRKLESIANQESSDLTSLDEITDTGLQDAQEAESTVLYHIYKHSAFGYEGIKEYINSVKLMKTGPEYILHPFQLSVLLTIAATRCFEDQALEAIRMCVTRSIQEEFKRKDSIWFEEMVPGNIKVDDVFLQIIEHSVSDRELIVKSLVNIGLVFLGVKVALGTRHIAERHWELGNLILLKLLKKKREAAATIIRQICEKIGYGCNVNVTQYTDCLYNMSKNLALIMLENQTYIIQLIAQLPDLPGNTARLIVNCVLPLVKVSHAIRDNLILNLRKSLWGKMLETRQMAVTGFLTLLRNVKYTNLAAFSLSQTGSSGSSGYSFITQLSIDCRSQTHSNKFNNEALCLEVLTILRRCFLLEIEVRSQFYEGMFEAVCLNSELGIPVWDMLWDHCGKFYVFEEERTREKLPPIDFSSVTANKNNEVVLQEPVGKLIFTLGLIATKIKEILGEEHGNVRHMEKKLNSLLERMCQCELFHFGLDDTTDLNDTLPESQTKLHTLREAILVYEALIGYLIASWDKSSENYGKKIINLFQGYSKLADILKNINRPKKAEGKKKKDGKTQDETEKNKSLKQKTQIKLPVTHILDLQCVAKMLKTLYELSVPWTTAVQTSQLKIKREFHRYILTVGLYLIQNFKNLKPEELKVTNIHFTDCVEITTILYEKIIQRYESSIDFDVQTTLLSIELFHNILSFITTQFKPKFQVFLCKLTKKERDLNLGELLEPLIDDYKKLIMMEENDNLKEDSEGKKIPVALVNTFTLLVMSVPKDRPEAIRALDWLKHYLDGNELDNRLVANALISLWFNLHIKCKPTIAILESVAVRLCDVVGCVNPEIKPDCTADLRSLNEGTVLHTLTHLTACIKTLLDEVNWLINRFKSDHMAIMYTAQDKVARRRERLKTKERELCCHVHQIITVCQVLGNLGVPNGTYTEAIIKTVIHLYNTLSNLAKYFMIRSSKINKAFESARFEKVVISSGKQFNNIISDFILSIEQNQDPDNSKKAKDGYVLKSKVLKDTRLIPKLVYEIEQYGKTITQLSNKTKVDLSKYIGPGTSRDFRIKAPDLKAALEKNNSSTDDTYVTADDNESHDNISQNELSQENVEETVSDENMEDNEDSDKENESENDENVPPKKKAKKGK